MKYVFEQKRGLKGFANVKAPRDIAEILHKEGYKTLYYSDETIKNKIVSNLFSIFMTIRILFIVKRGDICFLQWPLYTKSTLLLYFVLRLKGASLLILIHDLKSIRYNISSYTEKKYFSLADLVIAHTQAMSDYLVNIGVDKGKIRILTSFDYIVCDKDIPQRVLSNEIVYAGNLKKSRFLLKLIDAPKGITLNCYGKCAYEFSNDVRYMGFFDSDNVATIQGSWGLVWDGDSIKSCEGVFGKYLRINSPHKLSLYIVARLPLIVWRESALAEYVSQKGLGLLIDSLYDIPARLEKITEKDYHSFLNAIDIEREELIHGQHLLNSINNLNNNSGRL